MNNIKLGYACLIHTNDKHEKELYKVNRRLTVKKANTMTEDEVYNKCKQLTRLNFDGLYNVMKYNIENGIHMYRVSSDMIVLDNHELNTYKWYEDSCVINLCNKIKQMAIDNDIRLSMHTNRYNVISTHREDVLQSTTTNLLGEYRVAKALGIDTMCIHVGSTQGGKEKALERFYNNFKSLPPKLQECLCIENDDKSYNVEEVLGLCKQLNIRMILDIHHNNCLPSTKSLESYIDDIINTWGNRRPKCHLSTGKTSVTDRAHADDISLEDYMNAIQITKGKFDIMLECKNKQLGLKKLLTLCK